MFIGLLSLVFSSTIVGNPINNLHVLVDGNVYKSTITVVGCDNSNWTSEEDEFWISTACEVHVEVCDEEEDCWYEEITLQPEDCTELHVQKTGYFWL